MEDELYRDELGLSREWLGLEGGQRRELCFESVSHAVLSIKHQPQIVELLYEDLDSSSGCNR